MPATSVAAPSLLSWMLQSVGPVPALFLVGMGVFAAISAVAFCMRSRAPLAPAGLVLVTLFPLIVGGILAFSAAISGLSVIAMSSVAPKPSEIASIYSGFLFTCLLSLLSSLPAVTIGIFGSFLSAFSKRT